MKLIQKLVLIIGLSTGAFNAAAQKTTYYDLVMEKISLPSMSIDTAIKMRIDIRVFNNKGKELMISTPVTLKNYEISLALDKKLVDVIRGSEMYIDISLTNNFNNSYSDSTKKEIHFRSGGYFTLESQGSKELGFIWSPTLPKELEGKLLWNPVFYWRLEKSELQ